MNQLLNYLMVVAFGFILILPIFNDNLHIFQFERKEENRKFNDSLSISVNKLDKFPKDFENYLSDNFSFRTPLIAFSKEMKFRYFQVSPDKEEIIIGKKNRYFIANEHLKIFEGEITYGKSWLDTLETEWVRRKHYLDSLGIPVHLVIAPIAHEIYPEELPNNILKRKGENPIELIANRLNKRYPHLVFNPISILLAHKSSEKLYYDLDHHWTENGGFLVAKKLLQEIKRNDYPQLDLTPLNDFTWKKNIRKFGHFVSVLAVDDLNESILLVDKYPPGIEKLPHLNLDFDKEGVSVQDQQAHFRSKNCKNKLRVLVIRDSFGGALMPAISACFSESLFIFDSWKYHLNKSVIEKYQPDLIIYVTYEQMLKHYTDPFYWE
ncbi:alginate O-acetyltransferase AlgX-related protein [Fluviicola sp.]|uniref:alginate O-acetyltransferase AlgX-related protein n=1 Tax=Fluviicola sp. TaxID=1917219 RepID=UPI003D2E4473